MTDLVFGEWLPDQNDTENPGVIDALNVIARTQNSYGPVRELSELYNALSARCQGAGAFRGSAGTVFNVAADQTNLYELQSATWTDISGSTYNVQAEDMVRFTQFGDLVIAANGTDAPQAADIEGGGNFAALGGSPLIARDVTTLRDFVFFGGVASDENKVFWSGFNDPDFYTFGTSQSDEQSIPEGGAVQRVIGGEFGTVLMERSIYRVSYVGADSGVFQFDRIHEKTGSAAPNAVAADKNNIFFLDWDGFYMLAGGTQLVPIGDQKLDNYFWSRVNQSYLYRIVATVDPLNKRYVVAYPTEASTDGTPDEILFFPWTIGRWSRAEIDVEYLTPHLSGVGYHTDNIDTVIGNTDATDFSVDTALFGGSGQASLAAFTTNHKVASFTGATLAWLIETLEGQLNRGRRTLVSEVWPEGDATGLSVALGYRNMPNEAVQWTSFMDQNEYGFCPTGIDARYQRARVAGVADTNWSHMRGINLRQRRAGRY